VFGARGVDDAADTINLGNSHGFVTGDEVIYSTDGAVIGGLDSGARYFVIVTESGLIQLAATYEEAVGVPGDDEAEPPIAEIPVTPLALTPSALAADQNDVHSLRRVANQPIGGLIDGVTYYVDRINADSFRLLDAPAGATVALNPLDPVSGAVLTGTSTLGKESVDLTNAGSGQHRLVIDIIAAGSGTQIFEGVGGARALAGAPSGDGVVTAAASGSGGGLVRVSDSEVSASSTPTVNVAVGAGARLTAQDIQVGGTAKANVSAMSANSGGGLVSVGDAEASITADTNSAVTIGTNARLNARNDISITSLTIQNASVLAQSNGGGLVDHHHRRRGGCDGRQQPGAGCSQRPRRHGQRQVRFGGAGIERRHERGCRCRQFRRSRAHPGSHRRTRPGRRRPGPCPHDAAQGACQSRIRIGRRRGRRRCRCLDRRVRPGRSEPGRRLVGHGRRGDHHCQPCRRRSQVAVRRRHGRFVCQCGLDRAGGLRQPQPSGHGRWIDGLRTRTFRELDANREWLRSPGNR
jgi:hypothetical protein